jgi:predicted ATPase
MAEAISLAKKLNDIQALTNALFNSGVFSYYERDVSKAERIASDTIELSTRHNFAFFSAIGSILSGWAWSASGKAEEGILSIENGIQDYLALGSRLAMPAWLGLKAEALYLAHRTSEALEAIEEAIVAERSGLRSWSAELRRLRGVFLAAMGAEESQIEASFGEAIRIAKEQKSVSLQKRAETTYAEYRRQKASGSGGRGFRLPIC